MVKIVKYVHTRVLVGSPALISGRTALFLRCVAPLAMRLLESRWLLTGVSYKPRHTFPLLLLVFGYGTVTHRSRRLKPGASVFYGPVAE